MTLLGLASLLICSIPVTTTEKVISVSFAVGAGAKYGPYDEGTTYHTRVGMKILSKSVLRSEVFVEGEGIYLAVNGYNSPQAALYVKGLYSLIIDPADDQYTFTFDNSKGNTESFVRFRLEGVWTRPMAIGSPPLFIAGLAGFFAFLAGLVALGITHLKSRAPAIR